MSTSCDSNNPLVLTKTEFKSIQRALGWSNAQLASRLGVSSRTVEEYRREQTRSSESNPPRPIPSVVALAMKIFAGDVSALHALDLPVNLGDRFTLALKPLADRAERLVREQGLNTRAAIYAAADQMATQIAQKD